MWLTSSCAEHSPCSAMHHVEDFAVLMCRENVAILGKDDKVLSPILMTMEYPVTLSILLSCHPFTPGGKLKRMD